MLVSYKWLSEFVDLSKLDGPDALADLLTARGLEAEDVRPQAKGFDHVVTVQILDKKPHPQADRLSLCQVSLGSGAPLEIVCGAQNMKAGDKVVLAQIGADLPNGLKITKSKIRGVESNGMLCSEEELKLKDKADGLLILPPDTPLGRPLAEILGLDDTILTLKLTANRGDCLSHFGLAREVAAALGVKVRADRLPKNLPDGKSPIALKLEAGESAPQFLGCYIEGAKIGPSPAWVVKRLEVLGQRSINNVVDATNLVLLELGHPVHAYDADRIEGGFLAVRMARAGETLPLLDGTTIELGGSELVIADGKKAVGLAGVMGGGNSEVSDGTTRLFLECAEFAPTLVRRASAKHQKKTEAAHRFERGVDPSGAPRVLARLAQLVMELAGGRVVGTAIQQLPSRSEIKPRKIMVDPAFFADYLGIDLKEGEAQKVLEGLDCEVKGRDELWNVTPPLYRSDLYIREDLAEEIARSVGYDRIESTIPVLKSTPRVYAQDEWASQLQLLNAAKDSLAASGLSESLNFGFNSKGWLAECGFAQSVPVLNPLSAEHEALVPSLVPGLLQNAILNTRHYFGTDSAVIRLFELRPTFHLAAESVAAQGELGTGIQERWKLSFVISGPRFAGGLAQDRVDADFYDAKAVVEKLFEAMGTKGVRFQPLSNTTGGNALFHPGQSVQIAMGKNQSAGVLGLLHPAKAKAWKLRAPLWICELDWEPLIAVSRNAFEGVKFQSWSDFPPMERDFALLVKSDVPADKLTQVALKAGKPLARSAKVFDVYRGKQIAEGMTSVAVRVIFFDGSRSLLEPEVEGASQQILQAWKKELGVELRGT